jgi:preprotein translocase subunit YajC
LSLIDILAQTTQPTTATAPPPGFVVLLQQVGPILLIVVVFYFIFMAPKKKQAKERQDMLGQLKKGDRIQTIGGILGTVVEVREGEVLVKVDESSNTKIRFARSAIHRVVEEDKTESK